MKTYIVTVSVAVAADTPALAKAMVAGALATLPNKTAETGMQLEVRVPNYSDQGWLWPKARAV